VVTSDGVVMIDAPVVPSTAEVWKSEIGKHGALRYIINNEPHIDHFGGDAFFPGTIVAREEARMRIAATPLEEMTRMLTAGAPESLPVPEGFRYRLPEITFSENLTLFLGDRTFEILAMPGHTDCQTVVYVPEERVLFTGDEVANRVIPSLHQALPMEWLESLERLRKLDVEYVVPGHGDVGGRGLIDEMARSLNEAIAMVREAMAQGMGMKEAKDRLHLFADYGDFIPGAEHRRWMNRVNVGRLYEVLTGST
jgi:cyclase